jgi:hypothetical protein
MSSTLGGEDEAHDFTAEEKNRLEKALRKEGEELRRKTKPREGQRKKDRANEISRNKSKKAHQ